MPEQAALPLSAGLDGREGVGLSQLLAFLPGTWFAVTEHKHIFLQYVCK